MDEKHIANGDVDFEGVINLEPHEKKQHIIVTFKTISIMLISFLVEVYLRYYEIMIYFIDFIVGADL